MPEKALDVIVGHAPASVGHRYGEPYVAPFEDAMQARLGANDYDRASEDFTQAIQIGPSAADFYSDRSEACRLRSDYVHAVADRAMAAELDAQGHKFKD